MLRNIHPLLGPDLLHALRSLGHGDELVIADANFPAHSLGPTVVRLDGVDAVSVADAILAHLPLDTFVDDAAFHMEVVGDAAAVPPIVGEFAEVIRRQAGDFPIRALERHAFYERAKTARLIVATGETRHYGNLLLTTGVL